MVAPWGQSQACWCDDSWRDWLARGPRDTLFPHIIGFGPGSGFSATSGWLVRWRWTHPTIAFFASVFLICCWCVHHAGPRTGTIVDSQHGADVIAAQYVLGLLDVVLLAPLWLQIAHLLGADFLWAALVVLVHD